MIYVISDRTATAWSYSGCGFPFSTAVVQGNTALDHDERVLLVVLRNSLRSQTTSETDLPG